MPTCTQCGSSIPVADSFCTQCGAPAAHFGGPSSRPSVSDAARGESAGPRESGPVSGPSIATRLPQLGQMTRKGWWLLGGAALVLIGSLLPWAQDSVDGYSAPADHPGGGGVAVFLVLAIAVVAAGWPLLTGGISKRRLMTTSAVAALLGLFAVTNWSDLNSVQKQADRYGGGFVKVSVTAGSGLVLYTVGVLILCVLITRLWLPLRRAAPATV